MDHSLRVSALLALIFAVSPAARAKGIEAALPPLGAMAGAAAPSDAEGTIRVVGADAMVPLMKSLGKEFGKLHPKVKIEVSGGGAGKGVKEALAGNIELGMVSRAIEAEEAERCSAVAVAKDAVFATVNANNPVAQALAEKGLSKKAFKALWLAGKESTWGGLTGGANKDAVKVVTREDACGAAEIWAKFLGATQGDLQGKPVKGDSGIADAVRKDPLALGYNNLQAAYDLAKGNMAGGLLVVPIDANDNGKVDPAETISTKEKAFAAIASGAYPSPPARSLNLLTKGKFSGVTLEFVKWILGEGQKTVGEVGYIPLDKASAQAALKKLAGSP